MLLSQVLRASLLGCVITSYSIHYTKLYEIDELPANPFLLYHLEGGAEYYLNGVKIFTETGSWNAYRTKEIPASAFVKGRNVLAIRCTPASNTRYMDVGVYDAGSLKTEQPVVGPSQPNLFTGLNGFEQFVAYKAFWNGVSGQGVDRVFYYNKDRITSYNVCYTKLLRVPSQTLPDTS